MSPSFASSLADLRVAGYYLPAVSFGYLFTQSQSSGYFWLSALGLVAAVAIHGVVRAFPDSDGNADPDAASQSSRATGHEHASGQSPTALQLTYAALHGGGNPASYPATPRDAVRNPTLPTGPRAVVAAVFVVLAALFVPLVPYSAWVLWTELPLDRMHPTYHLIGQTLVFLTATWTLQEVGWRLWPTVTVARRPASRDPQEGLEELRTFLTGPGGPDGVTHITYESRAGGYVLIDYVTSATTHDALRAELEDVAIGYLANALNDKYPCEEVSVSVLGDDRAPIGSFTIDGDWADAYADGDSTVRDYVERVWDSLELYRTSGRGLLTADSRTDDELQDGMASHVESDPAVESDSVVESDPAVESDLDRAFDHDRAADHDRVPDSRQDLDPFDVGFDADTAAAAAADGDTDAASGSFDDALVDAGDTGDSVPVGENRDESVDAD